jgi:glucose/arabinose dehydrogenase
MGILGAKQLHRVVLDAKEPHHVLSHEGYFEGDPPSGYGRLRDVVQGPDGALYVTTSNCDGRGNCPDDKDAILRILPGR